MTTIPAEKARQDDVVAISEQYYDSKDADNFYFNIWGGEDIHIGLYEGTPDIAEASRRTVEHMAAKIPGLGPDTKILDIGAGYGGAARHLARTHGCQVSCLNLSRTQNATNERLNAAQGLSDLIDVVHGNFEDVPEADETFDVVWSQDAILHSGNRQKVLAEVARVLKPGGQFIFTDPMQADDCPEGVLQPVYDRIHLQSLGSFAFYRQAAKAVGLEDVSLEDATTNLRTHYHRVREELTANFDRMAELSSTDYLTRMITGLENWVKAADAGHLAWGFLHFRKAG